MKTRLNSVIHLRIAPETLDRLKTLAVLISNERGDLVVNYSELVREAIDEYLEKYSQ